jgi:hypothetical protein
VQENRYDIFTKQQHYIPYMDLEYHYHTLWKESLQQFKNGYFEYDSMIDANHDSRYGITLLARPSGEVNRSIVGILNKLAAVAPQQYIYPTSDLPPDYLLLSRL